ncbi:DUF6716 putative glycosyltransferase [Demequina mangrovi]|uniref:Uncharacterized protein n=1 Tax=Demequina mangrovi TaxID=1043493 RepID=A0A1H7A0S4_9MICO|nr:DUF6716 putative glycosyltransferase [Demequina mangrovi]SEJ59299.1 hypothetical protein SAMN05421637_2340 [Demequina mangrovi]
MTASGFGSVPAVGGEAHGARRRFLVVADSDSYLKWGVTRALEAPADWDTSVVVVRNAVTPSPAQRVAAVHGRLAEDALSEMSFRALVELLAEDPPDVLLLACRGPLIETLLADELHGLPGATVVIAGIPGIWMPPTELGVRLRRSVDMLVVHSEREREAVEAMLPKGRLRAVGLASLVRAEQTLGNAERPRIVFAPQALVPTTLEEREQLFAGLVDLAAGRPDVDVVIKLRGTRDEAQTHKEFASFPEIAERWRGGDLPANLVFAYGPLQDFLGDCEGFVTVSSTAVLEAVRAGVPSLCLDDFGVSTEEINVVFEGSRLFGSLDDLRAGRFATPDHKWRERNYFHPPESDDWIAQVDALWAEAQVHGVVPFAREEGWRTWTGQMTRRAQALGAEDTLHRRTVAGVIRAARAAYYGVIAPFRTRPQRRPPVTMSDGQN